MKRYSFGLGLSILAVAGFFLAGCDKNGGSEDVTVVETPSLTVSSTVAAAAAGGQYSFTYTVENPADDGEVSCYADASWLSGFGISAGAVTFTADENGTGQVRAGNITIAYTYSGGVVNKRVGVVQSYTDDPTLTVETPEITVSSEGGSYSFTYTIDNQVNGGQFDCKANVSWIGGPDLSSFGTVAFTVEANETEELRYGEFTLSYAWTEGTLKKTVTIVQGHEDQDEDTGWDGTAEGLTGLYELSGYALDVSTGGISDQTWSMEISLYSGSDGYDVYLHGLTPRHESICGIDQENVYSARGRIEGYQLVIPSQVTEGQVTASGVKYYVGYTPCTDYSGGNFYYYNTFPDLVLTYDEETDSWESDLGMFLGGFTSTELSSFASSFDASVPTFTAKKVSPLITGTSLNAGTADVKTFGTVGENIIAE